MYKVHNSDLEWDANVAHSVSSSPCYTPSTKTGYGTKHPMGYLLKVLCVSMFLLAIAFQPPLGIYHHKTQLSNGQTILQHLVEYALGTRP